jgi:tol-pal system protein YbgF
MRNGNLRVFGAISVGLALVSAPITVDAAWWKPGQAAKPQGPVVSAQLAQGTDERFNRIESQMRTLTGQVEELTHQLRQLQDLLQRMQEDTEFRFRDLEGGESTGMRGEGQAPMTEPESAGSAPAPVPTLPPPSQPDAIGAITGDEPPPAAPPDLSGPGAPPRPLGTLTLDAPLSADQPIDLTRPLPPGGLPAGPDVAMVNPTGDPATDFDRAYGSVLSGDYDTAEAAFRQFLAAYPENERAADAQYWLGESLFVRARYRDAANEFLAGYKAYPKSSRAPDALLKLGLSLAGLGERDAACRTFDAVLKQYPSVSNALRQRVKFEQSSANC